MLGHTFHPSTMPIRKCRGTEVDSRHRAGVAVGGSSMGEQALEHLLFYIYIFCQAALCRDLLELSAKFVSCSLKNMRS